jgi:hypothetical protein
MISDPGLARLINQLLLDINDRLERSVIDVRREASGEEAKRYGVAVGQIIMAVFDEGLEPLYAQHPTLRPPDLR